MEICSCDASIYYLLQELFQELPKQTKETMKQASLESRELRLQMGIFHWKMLFSRPNCLGNCNFCEIGTKHVARGNVQEEQNLHVQSLWRGRSLIFYVKLQIDNSAGGNTKQKIANWGIAPRASGMYVAG